MKKFVAVILMFLLVFSVCSCTVYINEYEHDSTFGVEVQDFEVPLPEIMEVVYASEFGISPTAESNADAMRTAATYLAEHPGTMLKFDKGTYKFNAKSSIAFYNVRNCVIDGGESEFIFSGGGYFSLINCDGMLWKDFVVDWDYEREGPLVSLAECVAVDGDRVTFAFPYSDDVPRLPSIDWASVIAVDENLHYTTSDRNSFATDIRYEGGNRVSFKNSASFIREGMHYLIRHAIYGAAVFGQVATRNITYDNITLYGVRGEGFTANQGCEYIRLNRVRMALREGYEYSRRMSCTADGLHFADNLGHFIVENCDLGFTGDDLINFHDSVAKVGNISGNTVTVRTNKGYYLFEPGTKVAFYDDFNFVYGENSAEVLNKKSLGNEMYEITLDHVPEGVDSYWIMYNPDICTKNYIIRNNNFHDNRARNLLIQCDDGLIENNSFSGSTLDGLRFTVDYGGPWYESRGVHNVIVRNNRFSRCGQNYGINFLLVDVHISGNPFSNIVITDNVFSGMLSRTINIDHINGGAVCGNRIQGSPQGSIAIGQDYEDFYVLNNTWANDGMAPSRLLVFVGGRPSGTLQGIKIANNEIE